MTIHVRKGRKFTEQEIELIRDLAPDKSYDEIALQLGRTAAAIEMCCRSRLIQVRRTPKPVKPPSPEIRVDERRALAVERLTAVEVAKQVLVDLVEFGATQNLLKVGGKMRPASLTEIMRATNHKLAERGKPQVLTNPAWGVCAQN